VGGGGGGASFANRGRRTCGRGGSCCRSRAGTRRGPSGGRASGDRDSIANRDRCGFAKPRASLRQNGYIRSVECELNPRSLRAVLRLNVYIYIYIYIDIHPGRVSLGFPRDQQIRGPL
jgi:hypothetical protein